MFKKMKNKLVSIFCLVLMMSTIPVNAEVKTTTKENVGKYFRQNSLIASYFKQGNQTVEFYNSTKDPKINNEALANFKANSTVEVNIDFDLLEKSNGESYKPGDWFEIPLAGTLINYPEMANFQNINVEGEDILKFRVTKKDGKAIVYFEFTDKLTPGKYDYFEKGNFKIFGKVNNNTENSQFTEIGSEKITVDFSVIKPDVTDPKPGGHNVPFKLNGYRPTGDFDKKIYSASITSDIIKYEFNINQELVGAYYLDKNTNTKRKNLVLIDKLGKELAFKEDTFNLEVKLTLPCVGYKYNKNELIIENGRPVIAGISSRKTFIFNFIEKFKKVTQGSKTNKEFLDYINNNKFTYGITNDGSEFYLNLGDVGSDDYIISKINSDEKFKEYLNDEIGSSMGDKLKKYVIEDMLEFYGKGSKSEFKALALKIRATAEKTSYATDKYENIASLVYGENKDITLEDSVFTENYQTSASITPGAYNTITISKSDFSDNNIKLENVKFNLYKEGSDKIVSTATTDKFGIAKFTRLEAGVKYKVVEATAKPGYDINSYDATVSEGYSIDKDGYIQIGNEPGRQGVVLKATNKKITHKITLTKKDVNGKPLSGTNLSLEKLVNNEWKNVETVTTNSKGQLSIDGLLEGEYRFVETSATAGYDKNTFKLFNTAGKEIETFTISGTETSEKTFAFTATNELLTHEVTLTKKDVDGKPLSGTNFSLEKLVNNEWKNIKTVTTDSKGQLSIDGLLEGEYRFVETSATAGYDKNTFKLFNTAGKEIETFTISGTEISEKTFAFTATNELLTHKVTLTKKDVDGETLSGVKFELQKFENGKWITIKEVTTDSKGQLSINGLLEGEYKFVEILAHAGYDKNTFKLYNAGKEIETFTISGTETSEKTFAFTATNKLLTHKVTLIKKGINGVTLSGVDFELQKFVNGKWITIEKVTTDKNGKLIVDGLAFGKYRFVEILAHAGYDKDTFKLFDESDNEIESFTISNKETVKQAFVFTATNEKLVHNVILTKYGVDEYNFSKALKDVKFELQILTENGWETIDFKITDEFGMIKFNNLGSGKYRFVELETASGYMLDSFKLYNKNDAIYNEDGILESVNVRKTISEFEISDELTKTTTFEFVGTNTIEPVDKEEGTNENFGGSILPQTGDDFNKVFWLVLSFISGTALLLTNNKKSTN